MYLTQILNPLLTSDCYGINLNKFIPDYISDDDILNFMWHTTIFMTNYNMRSLNYIYEYLITTGKNLRSYSIWSYTILDLLSYPLVPDCNLIKKCINDYHCVFGHKNNYIFFREYFSEADQIKYDSALALSTNDEEFLKLSLADLVFKW